MDSVLDRPWTVESFLAWEDRQDGRHEFDGRNVIPMTGGCLAIAATLLQREPGGAWIATAPIAGELVLPGLAITLPLAALYQGLSFAAQLPPRQPDRPD